MARATGSIPQQVFGAALPPGGGDGLLELALPELSLIRASSPSATSRSVTVTRVRSLRLSTGRLLAWRTSSSTGRPEAIASSSRWFTVALRCSALRVRDGQSSNSRRPSSRIGAEADGGLAPAPSSARAGTPRSASRSRLTSRLNSGRSKGLSRGRNRALG